VPKDQRERLFLDAEQRIDAEIRAVDPGPMPTVSSSMSAWHWPLAACDAPTTR
jgi:hypothetical protein